MTLIADWFLNRAHFPQQRDRIRGRILILVLAFHLLFQTVLAALMPEGARALPFVSQILMQVLVLIILLTYTKITGHYKVTAIAHFTLQKVLMGLVFYRSESLHSLHLVSMGPDVVMASFILGFRLAVPLILFQALATLSMIVWAGGYAQELPFDWSLETHAGLLACSLLMAQVSMIFFSWLYLKGLEADYARLQAERARLFRSARSFDLSRMLGELNHHMNNPLSVVHAQLYRLAMQARKGSVPDEGWPTGASNQAMQKIHFMIEHLKVLASPDSQEERMPMTVRQICLHLLTHFQENFRLKGISLQFVDQTLNMSFSWRPHELFTILAALIQNAGEALEASSEKHVTVRIERSQDWLLFFVTDSGPGVPEEQRPQLFKPFHSTKAGSQHLGLSLLSSKALIEDRGGTIVCEDVAHGCSFQIRLPLTARLRG